MRSPGASLAASDEQDELALVRMATARFHRVDEAVAAWQRARMGERPRREDRRGLCLPPHIGLEPGSRLLLLLDARH